MARGSLDGERNAGRVGGGLDVGLLKIPPSLAQGKIIFNEQNDWVVSQLWVHQRRSEKEIRTEQDEIRRKECEPRTPWSAFHNGTLRYSRVLWGLRAHGGNLPNQDQQILQVLLVPRRGLRMFLGSL